MHAYTHTYMHNTRVYTTIQLGLLQGVADEVASGSSVEGQSDTGVVGLLVPADGCTVLSLHLTLMLPVLIHQRRGASDPCTET